MEYNIVKLNIDNLSQLKSLYKRCFLNDHYFINMFGQESLVEKLENSFETIFRFVLENELAFGIFEENSLISFILYFDYFHTKENNPQKFNAIFTMDENDDNFPYMNMHKAICELKDNTVYLLAIAVDENYRKRGIASCLLDYLLEMFPESNIVSDVSNKNSLKMYENRGFNYEELDNEYYLVIKRAQMGNI